MREEGIGGVCVIGKRSYIIGVSGPDEKVFRRQFRRT